MMKFLTDEQLMQLSESIMRSMLSITPSDLQAQRQSASLMSLTELKEQMERVRLAGEEESL